MITLPVGLNEFMKGQKLDGLKPFALLYRNKWDSVNNKFALEDTPIDISDLIAKPNTLSMTLDVNEVAQYNANNVTLTLSDTKNYFVEGTPNSYFPEGYQIYGSRIVLYYGTDGVNRTPLFTGVIKELPTHKSENYQVDVKLVSPLEMLKDIEAKDFSDKVTGETLTYKSTDSDGHRIYWTTGTGVGGFDAVYADGTKLFEGVDYETDQLNALGLPAIVTIINSDYYSSTITADYYTWKTGLTVEQIVAGLVGLAGYDTGTEDIRNVVWNNQVRSQRALSSKLSLGYRQVANNFNYSGNSVFLGAIVNPRASYYRYSKFNNNCKISFIAPFSKGNKSWLYFLGDFNNSQPYNGIAVSSLQISFSDTAGYVFAKYENGNAITLGQIEGKTLYLDITFQNSSIIINANGAVFSTSRNFTGVGQYNEGLFNQTNNSYSVFSNNTLQDLETQATIGSEGVIFEQIQKISSSDVWVAFDADLENNNSQYNLKYITSNDNINWNFAIQTNIRSTIGARNEYIQFLLAISSIYEIGDINNAQVDVLTNELSIQIVNLSGKTVLEALQDFALISGYEFGVDRQGVFFFRPRVASTTPTYILDHNEIVKVDTVKKNLSDFFTKLTLTFAQVPLEFYANTGERPTPVDRYGIINKEIDKPDIVNYDNPELAQAIGPQLLEVYSALPNVIQVTGKLNLALELGDIVSLRRNMNLITPEEYTDYSKYKDLNTYYRACKITGMNYNFSKKQITYTLRDVSNKNTEPQYEFNEYIYEHQLQFGVKE